MVCKTVVLTSKQNFVWHSMQEIIPFIVQTWKATEDQNNSVRIIDVDEEPLSRFLPELIQAHQVVLSCFTPKIFKIAQFIRTEMSNPARFMVHLHNQATIGCWPMRFWGGELLFQKKDVFISSCHRDADCLKVNYPEAQCEVIPFSFSDYGQKKYQQPTASLNEYPLIFIGRISSQKNLHTLLLSLSLLPGDMKSKVTLTFVGKEDNLGSPNMGTSDSGYADFLKKITIELGLQGKVQFEGFQDRSWIQNKLDSKKWIFIAPSLHSDENFGMAAFQCLGQKHLAVLSDWGGHSDFKKNFPEQVITTQVFQTPTGPLIDPKDLSLKIQNACEIYQRTVTELQSRYYDFDSIVLKTKQLAESKSDSNDTLKPSMEAETILSKVKLAGTQTNPPIFTSYQDSLMIPYFKSYGMTEKWIRLNEVDFACSNWVIVPWANIEGDQVIVDDPHRGHFQITLNGEKEQYIWLAERGWAFQKRVQ